MRVYQGYMSILILNLTHQHLDVAIGSEFAVWIVGMKLCLHADQRQSCGNCGKILKLPPLLWATYLALVYKKQVESLYKNK